MAAVREDDIWNNGRRKREEEADTRFITAPHAEKKWHKIPMMVAVEVTSGSVDGASDVVVAEVMAVLVETAE